MLHWFGGDSSTLGRSSAGAGDEAMSIASSQGSQGWEDENMEESKKAADKREIAYHIHRLEELGHTAGPRAKARNLEERASSKDLI